MTIFDEPVPAHLRKSLRSMLLKDLGTDTTDVFELELFGWYLTETEAVLNGMLSSETAYIQQQIKDGKDGIEEINDSGVLAVEYYTKRIRYSHVIYLTSLLETCLERACSKLTVAVGQENLPFSVNELTGDQWSKKRKFLERYGHFELPKQQWSEVKLLTDVRNYLVHENGNTASLSDDHRKALSKRPGVNVEGYEFKIEGTYVHHAFEAVKGFVQTVEERLGEVIRRATRPQIVP